MFAKQIVPFNGVWGASPLSSAMSKKPLETLTDKELIELASSKYHICATVDGKLFCNTTNRREIAWLDCPSEITIGELKKRLLAIPDDVTLEIEKEYGDDYSVYFYLNTIVPGIKTLTPEQREHIISEINLKISVQKAEELERKNKRKLEELKELERLEKKYLKLKNKLQK